MTSFLFWIFYSLSIVLGIFMHAKNNGHLSFCLPGICPNTRNLHHQSSPHNHHHQNSHHNHSSHHQSEHAQSKVQSKVLPNVTPWFQQNCVLLNDYVGPVGLWFIWSGCFSQRLVWWNPFLKLVSTYSGATNEFVKPWGIKKMSHICEVGEVLTHFLDLNTYMSYALPLLRWCLIHSGMTG